MDGKTLEQVRDTLLAKWKRMGKHTIREIDQQEEMNIHQAEVIDIAQGLEQMGRDASLREAERRELLAIERALTKISTGNFGMCEDCGEEIPSKRLIVLPEARLCAHCQAYEERQAARIRSPGASARF